MKEFLVLNRNLKLRLAIVFLGAFSYGTIFSSMTIYYNEYFGATITGLILIVSSLVVFFSGLIAGHFSDEVGRKAPMIWGILAQLAGALIALAANSSLFFNPWLTFIGFLFVSGGYNFVMTAGKAMIIDLTELWDRKIVFALDYWAQNLSVVIGAALGAWLFRDHFFELLLILVAGTGLTFFITYFFILESIQPAQLTTKNKNIFDVYKIVARDKTYMILMLANILAMSIIMQFDTFMPIHLSNDFQTFEFFGLEIYGQRMFTIYLIITCLFVVVFMTPINSLFRKTSDTRAFIIGTVLMTAGMILAFLTNTFWPIFISALIYTFGEVTYTPAIQMLSAEMMDPERIGAYNGAGAMRQPIASIIASLIVTVSPFIKPEGVSLILIGIEIVSVCFLIKAVKLHKKFQAL